MGCPCLNRKPKEGHVQAVLDPVRLRICDEAVSWLGTPFHHKARVKQAGVDCAQLVYGIALAVGLMEERDVPDYSTEWHLHNSEEKLLSILQEFGCEEITDRETRPGDIVTFRFGRVTSHLAIYMPDNNIIHASMETYPHRVVIHPLEGIFADRATGCWSFPGMLNV